MRSISNDEFGCLLRKCIPPQVGWLPTIAVANSGGPDSTCLLFLLHRYFSPMSSSHSANPQRPRNILSITVDHGLQQASSAMTDHCSKLAQSLGVKHLSVKIPWSTPPFPPRPIQGSMFENIARDARYHLLLQTMKQEDVQIIAMGHHADDQVETMFIRIGKGSTELGAAGMRHCRRWGMGNSKENAALGYAGYAGMNRWIVRPLLDVSKDRILATCEANRLEYNIDETNFQPHLTLRNALRARMNGNSIKSIPDHVRADVASVAKAASSFLPPLRLDDDPQHLRSISKAFSLDVEATDAQVSSILGQFRLPSFPGTFMISTDAISFALEQRIRRALILRILRYVSFYPWGSIHAEAKRRMARVDRIISRIGSLQFECSSFVAGAGVLWTPIITSSNKKGLGEVIASGAQSGKISGWLASRQPPMSGKRRDEPGTRSTLETDLTSHLRAIVLQQTGIKPIVEILWDHRYLVQFYLDRIPSHIAAGLLGYRIRIKIDPNTPYFWPCIVQETGDVQHVLHSRIDDTQLTMLSSDDCQEPTPSGAAIEQQVSSDWIHVKWIRPLDAL